MIRRLLILSLCYYSAILTENPCGKLIFFGNNIQNKAALSPVIVVGQRGMKLPFHKDTYNATIDIKTIIRGSLGDWKTNMIVASAFSTKNDSADLCNFQGDSVDSRVYFLRVLTAQTGEYEVLFNPEIASRENLDEIKKTVCNKCVEAPKLLIAEQNLADNSMQLDCTTDSKPTPIVKWNKFDGIKDVQMIELRNGARLLTKLVNSSNNNALYICTGSNVVGESVVNVIIKNPVSRCPINDNLLCNGQGKCYQDTADDGKMFCRCNPGFFGSRCSNNPNKLSSKYLMKSPSLDESVCNKNGEGYINVITKKEFCLCNVGFYGERCLARANKESRTSNNNRMVISPKDKSDIERMIKNATSKVALKYIIIGGAIVLAGCIIVVAVIIIMWKAEQNKVNRKMKHVSRAGNQSNADNSKLFDKYLEDQTSNPILPIVKPHRDNGNRLQDQNFDFGNGIYEGVTIQSK